MTSFITSISFITDDDTAYDLTSSSSNSKEIEPTYISTVDFDETSSTSYSTQATDQTTKGNSLPAVVIIGIVASILIVAIIGLVLFLIRPRINKIFGSKPNKYLEQRKNALVKIQKRMESKV